MASIREIDPERDAADIVALVLATSPTAVISEESWRHRTETVPERARMLELVADADGKVVARMASFLHFFGGANAYVNLVVASAHRRQGVGSELYRLGEEHALTLQPAALMSEFFENNDGVRFVTKRGYREVRAETTSVLDPRTVSAGPPTGIDIQPVRDVDPRLVYAVDEAATRDMPLTEPFDEVPYEEWVGHVLDHPLFTLDGSFVALEDGIATAVSMLTVDAESGRASNMFTGTLREYRGRGLGLAVKLASTNWAAQNGITQVVTANDETNAPMLAINRRLGYVPAGRRVEYVKDIPE
jgi:Acetyltransferase (GNAT) family.